VLTDFRTPAPDPQHQMRPRVQGGEARYPDVLKEAQNRELAVLVDQGVVGEDGEVEEQVTPPGWR
jgi:hypothetical protein